MDAATILVLHDSTREGYEPMPGEYPLALWADAPEEFRTRVWREIRVQLADATGLQGLVGFARALGRTARLTVEIEEAVGAALLHGPLGPVDGRTVVSLSREESATRTVLKLRLGYHTAVWAILASCLATPLSRPGGLGPGVRVGVESGVDLGWGGLASGVARVRSGAALPQDSDNPGPLPSSDLALVRSTTPDERVAHQHVVVQQARPDWREAARANPVPGPPLETRLFNPIGFLREPALAWAYLHPNREGYFGLADGAGTPLADAAHVTPGLVKRLRPYRGVVDSGAAFRGPSERASALLRLLGSGIPVVSPDAHRTLRGWLPEPILTCIGDDPTALDFSEDRERVVMRQVRAVHRHATWRSEAHGRHHGGLFVEPGVSVVMATMRPDFVQHLLDGFRAQSWPKKQLLLGLHGFELADLPAPLRARASTEAEVVEWPQGALFGDLLRELTARADGTIVAKMDDDDWYARHHLEDLVHALQYSGAALVGSGVQFVYMHNADITIRRSADQAYKYGGHPGGPTFMAPREIILAAGNWPRVRRAVDTGLNDAIITLGGAVYQSHPHNFLFNRRSAGHTWKATNEYFMSKSVMAWYGLRPPVGFDGEQLTNSEWRSAASTIGRLGGHRGLTVTHGASGGQPRIPIMTGSPGIHGSPIVGGFARGVSGRG